MSTVTIVASTSISVFSAAVGITKLLLTRRVNYTNKAAHVTARNFFISFNSRYLASARVTDSIQTLVLYSKILPRKTLLKHNLSTAFNSIPETNRYRYITFYFSLCVKRNSLALEVRSIVGRRRMRVDRQTLFAANTLRVFL